MTQVKKFMRYSKLFGKTLKEVPHEATAVSHQLLLRAGFIQQVTAGIYQFLPLGFRVLQKIDRIIREEFARSGVQDLLMPSVHPASLWEESGRLDKMGGILAEFQNEKGQKFVLAPTHEETVTDLARKVITSYKDMPVTLNQNQFKFRNELRVQGGLLRTREFIMQDAYSFDADQKGLDESYEVMRKAYCRVFDRIGIEYLIVQADSGAMGGSGSEEFMLWAEVGEDTVLRCSKCDYTANREAAVSEFETYPQDKKLKPMQEVIAPGLIGVEPLAKYLKLEVHQTTKTLLFQADDQVVVAMIRGEFDVNETKLRNFLKCTTLILASPETVKRVTKAEVGYAGPVNLPPSVRVIADLTTCDRTNFEVGGNKTNVHLVNVNFDRDFPMPEFVDIRETRKGDSCSKCKKGKLDTMHAIEIGHIFKLGTRYSEVMKAYFTDRDGKRKPIIMGCYGIGMTRLMAAALEVYHDEKGMMWPKGIAPFEVHLVALGKDVKEADKLYGELSDAGVEALYDDRQEAAGVKFNDADLIGIPVRILISERTLKNKAVEWKERNQKEAKEVKLKEVVSAVKDFYGKLNP